MDVMEVVLARILIFSDDHFAKVIDVVAAVTDFRQEALVLAAQRCHVLGKAALLGQRLPLLAHQLEQSIYFLVFGHVAVTLNQPIDQTFQLTIDFRNQKSKMPIIS